MNKKIILTITTLIFLFLTAIFGIISDYMSDTKRIQNISLVKNKLTQLKYIDTLVTELQRERGLSAIYYADPTQKHHSIVNEQRKKTDSVLAKTSTVTNLDKLNDSRVSAISSIERREDTRFNAFMNYTKIIYRLLLQSEALILNTDNSDIKNSLIHYNNLNIMQETAGQLRGLIGAIIATKSISKEEYNEIIILNRLFEESHKKLEGNTSLELNLQSKNIISTLEIINMISNIMSLNDTLITEIQIEPIKWFEMASITVDTIHDSIIVEMQHIDSVVNNSMENAKNIAFRHFTLWLLGTLLLIIVFVVAYMLSKRLVSEQTLLENYKDVIDNNSNSLVSKTDKYGVITYVNDRFCEVSKFKRAELIGKGHNIVRHEDTAKDIFIELWKSIKSGHTWNGILKNSAKDGSSYWVHASITPIYNNKGDLVEYIAMRHNITEMIHQKEETYRTQRELIYRLGESVESRSKESGNHIRRVSHYSKTLAELAGLNEEESDMLFIASAMHDMGKIAIPDSILLKPGKLTDEEFNMMKTHSKVGYNLLSGSNLPILQMASNIAYQHHEHYNGNGYPLGIKGDEISIHSKIVALVDVFDALISDRVYKKAWKYERVIETIKEESGQQFDPLLTKIFLDNIDTFMVIKDSYEDSV